jgi:hypothetical protein
MVEKDKQAPKPISKDSDPPPKQNDHRNEFVRGRIEPTEKK